MQHKLGRLRGITKGGLEIPSQYQLPRVGPFAHFSPVDYRTLSSITTSSLGSGGTRASPLIYNSVTINSSSSNTTTDFRLFLWCNTLTINNFRTLRCIGATGGNVDAPIATDDPGFGGPGASGGGSGGGTNSTGILVVAGGDGGTSGGNGQSGISSGGTGYASAWAFDGFDYGTPGTAGSGGDTGTGLGPGAGGSAWGGGGGGGYNGTLPGVDFNGAGGGGGGGLLCVVARHIQGPGNMSVAGGRGGNAQDPKGFYTVDSGGGGGGAGGVIYVATLSYSGNIGSLTSAGGAGGTSDGGFNGSNGIQGQVRFQEISHDWSTLINHPTLTDTWDNR